jgi:hypothetical protein
MKVGQMEETDDTCHRFVDFTFDLAGDQQCRDIQQLCAAVSR